ncbi:PREDICTED: stabilizer of axonemal microtubules 2-like isoform X1 [Acropora digitifera]|uniref:stabilizer of axonemal microtubules 2-like isoform X1 n=2 Tax=Acropora digitifera TaxID=70779 RepID=UPI00077AC2F4|nr:PREDICTED: stabilizer of axonemal microtubules 2-like isoform X1 [Acropora digitifera]
MVKPRCICQICTCGRHRCAHKPVARGPLHPCVFTEYQDRYKKHAVDRRLPFKPEYSVKTSNHPMEEKTNYRTDYISHVYAPPKKRDKNHYVKPQGQVNGESTYKHDYPGTVVPPATSAKPVVSFQTNDTPLESSTVHQDTYRPWNLKLCKTGSMKPDSTPATRSGKMDGKSIFQTDFPGYFVGRRPQIRPPDSELRINQGLGPMEQETTTRLDYTKKVTLPAESAKPVEKRPATQQPFRGNTTFMDDFAFRGGRPASSFKPTQDITLSNKPFDGDTTTGLTYQRWTIPKREVRLKELYRPPSAKFATNTTFHHDFPQWNVPPAESAKPPVASFASGKPFDDSTTHKEAFKAWEMQPTRKSNQTDEYRPPSGKFCGESTMRSHYRGQYVPPATPARHDVHCSISGDMMMNTTYKDTYTGDRPQSCPAQGIQQYQPGPQKGYFYTHENQGHSFYLPVSETVQPLSLSA